MEILFSRLSYYFGADLHLNIIDRMNGTSQERKVIRERNTHLVDLETSSIADVARETRSLPNPNHSESQALVVASPTPSQPIDSTEPISGPTQVSPAEQVIVPCNGNMSRLPDANLVEELNQGRPRSERYVLDILVKCENTMTLRLRLTWLCI